MTLRERFIGDREFYRRTANIAVPLALQNMLMSCMSIVDTLMVSWIGMVSAVGTAAQMDVLSGTISYGIIGGIGMFAAQFFGAGDEKNLKRCTGLCLTLVLANALIWFSLAAFFARPFLAFYIHDEQVIENGVKYLGIMKFSFLCSAVSFCLSSMYRSTHQPRTALIISTISGIANIILNWLLIYGIGPFPEMGVQGAALGTLLASMLSCIILITHANMTKQIFIGTPGEMFSFNKDFALPILARSYPLIINETIFSVGQTLFVKAFGELGKEQMDAYYVGKQIFEVMTTVIYGYGNAVQILLGTCLGKGNIQQAKKECDYHLGLGFMIACFIVTVLCLLAGKMVSLFALTDPVTEHLAVLIVYVFALKASLRLFNFMIFCILRSGGDVQYIQFLDAGIEWIVGLPSAFISVYVFGLQNIALVLLITQIEQLVRFILGIRRVKSYKWANDLTQLVTE